MENTLPRANQRTHRRAKAKPSELFAKILFIVCACLSIVAVFGIIGYILYGSIPAFREIGFFKFLFGTTWQPTHDQFGILPMLVNSLIVTFGALILGGTVGVFTAIFLAFWCPDKFHLKYKGENKFLQKTVAWINKINLRTIFDQIIKVLAGIPSIVYGLFGLEVLVSLFSGGSPIGGRGILTCSVLLAIMILPTVTSLSKNALDAVPTQYYEGALAMGNTKAQAVFRVVVPAARSGIISALILGVGRAVGEAMAVIWVSGNRALFPSGLFSYIRTLTTNIVMEMGYATDVHRSALIATGLVLLVLVLIITLSLNLVPKEFKGKRGNKVLNGDDAAAPVFRKKGLFSAIGAGFGMICAFLVAFILFTIIIYILVSGISCLTADFTTRDLAEAIRQGDPLALEEYERNCGYLVVGIVNLINQFNPSTIVIGDQLVDLAPELLLRIVREQVRQRLRPTIWDGLSIEVNQSEYNPIVMGAGALAAQMILENPLQYLQT